MPRSYRQEARNRLADQLEKRGPLYTNAAASVCAGYESFWITPALDALEATVRDPMGDDD